MDSDEGKLFIGGISWETTEEKLLDYFKAYGEVVEAVIMKDRTTGRTRGFGFVVFADPAMADRVVLEKHTIDGRVVEAKKALPREEQQSMSRSNSTYPAVSGNRIRTKKIFVGGLASTVTERDFRAYFDQFGTITDAVVMYDRNTQQPRGFGFITYDTEDAVDRVLQKPYHELAEKSVEVKRAIPKELSSGNAAGRPSNTGFGGGGGGGAGRGASSFGGYGQSFNSNPGSGYGPPRYGTAAPNRGSYPSYGPGGYGPGAGYAPSMNGGYGSGGYAAPTAYTGQTGYGSPTGYAGPTGYPGALPAGTGYGAQGAPGYGAPSSGAKSPMGGGTGYPGNPAGYGTSTGGAASGYGVTGWMPGGVSQSSGANAGYGSAAHGYAGDDSGYGPTSPGYGSRGGPQAGPTGYGSVYPSSAYGDSSWRPGGGDFHTSPLANSNVRASAAVGIGGSGVPDAPANGPPNYAGSYGATGRQTQMAPDTRFRPYPAQ